MKVAIVSTIVPFIEGGGTFIVDWLHEKLVEYGHEVEVIKIPFHSYAPEMPEQMLALRLLDLSDYGDVLIAIRTPSYIVNHPNKVVWFIHHHRGAYDLWGTIYQGIPNTPEGLKIRDAIIQTDNQFLPEAKKIFTNSKVVSDRLKKYNDIDSEVLYPPLLKAEMFHCREYGDFIFYPCRITKAKRQDLAIESMKYTKSDVKLVIAGKPDVRQEMDHIKNVLRKNKVEDKVEIINRWISEEEKVELFADALGCLYIPIDEDSYGYTSLEAFHSRKPVITCSDSGGTLELVEDGVSGIVVTSEPKDLAAAMDRLYNDRQLCKRMGDAAFNKLSSMNISWEHVIESLIG